MHIALRSLAIFVPALLLANCACCSTQTPPVEFSGVTRQDVIEIESLVTRRDDILKPVVSVRAIERSGGGTRSRHIQVVSGRNSKVGDAFDEFDVAKRQGRWVISSPILRDRIVVTGQ